MRTDSGSVFVDANILVYAALTDDPRHEASKNLLRKTTVGRLHISPQILAEFYSTITSPKRVTAPYTPREAVEFIEALLGSDHVVVLPISQDVPNHWLPLARDTETRGPHVFDLRIVATMLTHGVAKLLTYNGRDFERCPDIETSEPE